MTKRDAGAVEQISKGTCFIIVVLISPSFVKEKQKYKTTTTRPQIGNQRRKLSSQEFHRRRQRLLFPNGPIYVGAISLGDSLWLLLLLPRRSRGCKSSQIFCIPHPAAAAAVFVSHGKIFQAR